MPPSACTSRLGPSGARREGDVEEHAGGSCHARGAGRGGARPPTRCATASRTTTRCSTRVAMSWWSSAKDIGYHGAAHDGAVVRRSHVIPYQANLAGRDRLRAAEQHHADARHLPGAPEPDRLERRARSSRSPASSALVAQAFPSVTNFIVGNEPNVNRFWQPQYVNGQDAAAKPTTSTRLRTPTTSSSSRGPTSSSGGRRSPRAATTTRTRRRTRDIRRCGSSRTWATPTGRRDGRRRSSTSSTCIRIRRCRTRIRSRSRSSWPQAGAANLDRIKQALWDAFHGNGQRLPAEQAGQPDATQFAAPHGACRSSSTRSASRRTYHGP